MGIRRGRHYETCGVLSKYLQARSTRKFTWFRDISGSKTQRPDLADAVVGTGAGPFDCIRMGSRSIIDNASIDYMEDLVPVPTNIMLSPCTNIP